MSDAVGIIVSPFGWVQAKILGSLSGGDEQGAPAATKLELQSMGYGRPIAIVYGTRRVGGSLIWYADFASHKHKHDTGGFLGVGGVTTVDYTYSASFMTAVCEGPINKILYVFEAQKTYPSFNTYTKTVELTGNEGIWAIAAAQGLDLGFHGTLLTGNPSAPSTWAHLTSHHPAQALTYAGTGIVCKADADLAESPSLPQYSYETIGLLPGTTYTHTREDDAVSPDGEPVDVNPADVINDLLTNTRYGASIPASKIDAASVTDLRNYCNAMGFYLSPAIVDQKPALEHVKAILDACNAELVWSSDGKLKFVPYADTDVANDGRGFTYTAKVTPVYAFSEDDIVVSSPNDDPVRVEAKSFNSTYNIVPVSYTERTRKYETVTAESPESSDIELTSTRRSGAVSMPSICRKSVALQISRLLAQRSCWVKNTYTFRVGWRGMLVEPMDFVTITDAKFSFANRPLRVVSVDDDTDHTFSITAEEWPIGTSVPAKYDLPTVDGTSRNLNEDPGFVNEPKIVNAPFLYAGGEPGLVVATASPNTVWGGCDMWLSFNGGTTYEYYGRHEGASIYGTLYSPLASGTQDDPTNTIYADLAISKGSLSSAPSATAKDDLERLMWVDGELIGYQTASLTGTNRYALTSLRRGCYGTPISAHALGATVIMLDEVPMRVKIPRSRLGATVYAKFPSYNIYGMGVQDIGNCPAYSFIPVAQTPPYPATCTISFADSATVAWTHTAPYPASLLVGFRAVIYSGGDPNLTASHLCPPIVLNATARSVKTDLVTPAALTSASAAVQALYSDGHESSWRTSSGSVVVDPDTMQPANRDLSNVNDEDLLDATKRVGAGTNLLYNSDWSSVSSIGGYVATNITGWAGGVSSGASWGNAIFGVNLSTDWTLGGSIDTFNFRYTNTVFMHQPNRQGVPTTYADLWNDPMPVEAGQRYIASIYSGSHRAKVQVGIVFYADAAGNQWINAAGSTGGTPDYHFNATDGTNDMAKAGGPTLAGYKRIYTYVDAPSNAVCARVVFRKWDTNAGYADSYMFLCRGMFEKVGAATTLPSPWAPSPKTIVDADMVRANAILAKHIKAGEINVTHLSGEAIKTNDYWEDGNGVPQAGAKMQVGAGSAYLKVASKGLQVGARTGDQMMWPVAAGKIYCDYGAISVVAGSVGITGASLSTLSAAYMGVNCIRVTLAAEASLDLDRTVHAQVIFTGTANNIYKCSALVFQDAGTSVKVVLLNVLDHVWARPEDVRGHFYITVFNQL